MLKIQNLKKYFGGVKAVDGCSFEIKKGTITALIGPNGAGKSTLFNVISGISRADSGRIVFNGKDITNLPPEIISNSGMSRLFQQTRLFNNMTVKENLLLAFDNEDMKFWKNLFGKNEIAGQKQEKINEKLRSVGMEKFENNLARDLSYGQKRLIELLRAILKPHQLLMLDEPVAGVNPKLRREIGEILRILKSRGETILLIEHDMNFTLKIADMVVVMEKGGLIAQGRPEEIRNNSRVLQAYLGE